MSGWRPISFTPGGNRWWVALLQNISCLLQNLPSLLSASLAKILLKYSLMPLLAMIVRLLFVSHNIVNLLFLIITPDCSGASRCSWSSCREGCTRDLWECRHVYVEYTPHTRDAAPPAPVADTETREHERPRPSSPSSRVAVLQINIRGCGYPPGQLASDWLCPCHVTLN